MLASGSLGFGQRVVFGARTATADIRRIGILAREEDVTATNPFIRGSAR